MINPPPSRLPYAAGAWAGEIGCSAGYAGALAARAPLYPHASACKHANA